MNRLEPMASTLLAGRDFTQLVAVDHFQQFASPLTPIARAQTMRSVVQGLVLDGRADGFRLVDHYLHFGRVEVVHSPTEKHYLLKSRNALPVETSRQGQFVFDHNEPSKGTEPLELLLYRFAGADLTLATVTARGVRINERLRFELLAEVVEAGTWSSAPEPPAFDPGPGDDFGDLSEDVTIVGERDL